MEDCNTCLTKFEPRLLTPDTKASIRLEIYKVVGDMDDDKDKIKIEKDEDNRLKKGKLGKLKLRL